MLRPFSSYRVDRDPTALRARTNGTDGAYGVLKLATNTLTAHERSGNLRKNNKANLSVRVG